MTADPHLTAVPDGESEPMPRVTTVLEALSESTRPLGFGYLAGRTGLPLTIEARRT